MSVNVVVTNLLATIEPYQDVLHLAARRMEASILAEAPARDPDAGFDLDALIQDGAFDYPESDEAELELQVRPELAYHLGEPSLSEGQSVNGHHF